MTRRLVALLFMLGATFVWATASPAGAGETPCEFDSRTGELMVGPLERGRIVVRLRGRDILIDRRPCGATVTNTDSIRIVGSNVATFFFQEGLPEPGRTLEPD